MTRNTRFGDGNPAGGMRPDLLRVQAASPGGMTPVVSVSGEIDLGTRARLAELLSEEIASGPPTLLVDLSEVAFLDSAGLGVLISADRVARESGTRLVLVTGGSTAVQRLVRLLDPADLPEYREHVEDGLLACA